MPRYDEGHEVKIEAGQIINPDHFPPSSELVCIQVPKVFDQVALRSCETTSTVLTTITGTPPTVTFDSADNFDITEIKIISKTDSFVRAGFKRLKLAVTISYDIFFSIAGVQQLPIPASTTFNLLVNEIYCPGCQTQIGFVRYPESQDTIDVGGMLIKVEGLVEVFNDAITITSVDGISYTFTLALDIGVFFIVKCECDVQLLIPCYGYCPVPPEQQNPSLQACVSFNNRCITPFPTVFYPDQKWNPLDKG